jgi:hypothetical protein
MSEFLALFIPYIATKFFIYKTTNMCMTDIHKNTVVYSYMTQQNSAIPEDGRGPPKHVGVSKELYCYSLYTSWAYE